MQIRNLGGSGLRVSAVGLGCNNFGQRVDLEGSRKVIHRALDLGITLFDTADIYAGMGGSETVLGTVLGDKRKDIVLATKYSKPMASDGTKQGASRRYIMNAVEASLRRLKTDYIDLYQQHDYDELTPIDETLREVSRSVRWPKLLQPSPTAETRKPEPPRLRICMGWVPSREERRGCAVWRAHPTLARRDARLRFSPAEPALPAPAEKPEAHNAASKKCGPGQTRRLTGTAGALDL